MKKIAYMTIHWGDEYGKPPKTPEERARDEALAVALLERVKAVKGVKVLEFRAPVPRIPGYEVKEELKPSYRLQIDGQQAIEALLDLYQPAAHLVTHFPVWKAYTPQELESAPLLRWVLTNQAIEDDWYDLKEDGYQGGPKASHKRCPACRAKLEQVRDLLVNVQKMGKRALSLTYGFEVIFSARLAQMLQESGLTGFTLRPVWDYRRPHQGEPRLFQLVVTNVLPPMVSPPTEFEEERRCEVCGTESQFLKHNHWWGCIKYYEETEICYRREVLGQVADLNRTTECFGELPVAKPYVLISQRAYRWLREQKVKGWKVEPVHLVE